MYTVSYIPYYISIFDMNKWVFGCVSEAFECLTKPGDDSNFLIIWG